MQARSQGGGEGSTCPSFVEQNVIGFVCLHRKYASAAVLEDNVEKTMESLMSGVERQNGVIDVPEEFMRAMYSFLSTMCFGKP